MQQRMTVIAAIALTAWFAANVPSRADDDCDTVVTSLQDAQSVATKTVEQTMDEIKKVTTQPTDDKRKASVKNVFCSVSGEYLGTTRAFRAVVAECLKGSKRASTLSSLDKSISEIETAIDNTCK